MRNDDGKALSCQAYYEATEPVRMLVFVRQRECQITDYDSRSTWDRFLDAGSIPVCGIIFFSEIFVKSMFARISEFFVLCIPFGGKDIIQKITALHLILRDTMPLF